MLPVRLAVQFKRISAREEKRTDGEQVNKYSQGSSHLSSHLIVPVHRYFHSTTELEGGEGEWWVNALCLMYVS